VASVVDAEGGITRDEHAYLRWMTRKLGLSTDALRGVQVDDAVVAFGRLPGPLRYLTLQLAIGFATVEGDVGVAARACLTAMAEVLGLSEEYLDARIARALERPEVG